MAGTNPLAGAFNDGASSSKNPLAGAFSAGDSGSTNPLAGAFGPSRTHKPAANIGDVLDAPRAAIQEGIFHKGSSEANREALRSATGLKRSYDDPRLFGSGPGTPGIPVPEWLTHLGRGLTDTVIDTETDPVGAVGGLAGKALKGGLGLLGRGAKTLESTPLIGGKMADLRADVQRAGDAAHDFTTYAGQQIRDHGKATVDHVLGLADKHGAIAEERTSQNLKPFEELVKGQTDDDLVHALRLVNGEAEHGAADPKVQGLADGLHGVLDGLRRDDNALPLPRAEDPAGHAGYTHNTLDKPSTFSADDALGDDESHLSAIEPANISGHLDAIRHAIKQSAHEQQRPELIRELEDHFAAKLGKRAIPADIRSLFDHEVKATGDARTPAQWASDKWKGLLDVPKRAVVGFLPRHAANILSLATAHDPGAVPEIVKTTAALLKNPEQRFDLLEAGRNLGAIGERSDHGLTPFGWLDKMGVAGDAIKGWGKGVNDLTWAVDDAAAQTLAKRNAARGVEGYSAGRDARKALVDYGRPSPATKRARTAMSFGTFETGIVGSLAKAIAKNPAKVEALNRATGGTLLGGQTELDGHTYRSSLPPSKVGRLFGGDMLGFARGAAADPVRALASFSVNDKAHYMTYGLNPRTPDGAFKILTNMAAGGVPEARDILEQMGDGPFKPTKPFWQSLAENATGVQQVR